MSGAWDVLRQYGTQTIAVAILTGGIGYVVFSASPTPEVAPLPASVAVAAIAGAAWFLAARRIKRLRSPGGQDLEDRLLDVRLMFIKGQLTQAEHDELRRKILDGAFKE